VSEYFEMAKTALNTGVSGLMVYLGWKFLDKWAGRFLEAQNHQAEALGSLADAVKTGQGEQREVLLAVRVMASKMDEMKGWLRALDEHFRAAAADKGAQ
jgi:hypothetical protein